MKKKDLIFKEKNEWLQRVTWNDSFPKFIKKATEYVKKADNSEEFVDLVLADKELLKYQAYAELSRCCRPEKHWYKIREMFGERTFKTSSDVGGVMVGNKDFEINIPNGYGDGITRVAVFSKKDSENFNDNMMDYYTSIRGEFYIYDNDCADRADVHAQRKKLNGKYIIYRYNGLVAFVEY